MHIAMSAYPYTYHLWFVAILSAMTSVAGGGTPDCDFIVEGGTPITLEWMGTPGSFYDLWTSGELTSWSHADGFPRAGTGQRIAHFLKPATQGFFRVATSPDDHEFLYPEILAYRSATDISYEAAVELNEFLRHLRAAGVEPALFWVGGSRYGSISGSTARAIIGGDGVVSGSLGVRSDRSETFSGSQIIRFVNPLKYASQARVGHFAGASPATETGSGGLITGGEANPKGPKLAAAWGGGNFRVSNDAGQLLNHSGYGGFAKAGAFLPYVGGVYDGYFSVLCGVGKSAGSRANPLRFYGLARPQFTNNQFVNYQDYVDLGGPYYSGKLHFAVVTANDLTDNARAYELISIPRRVGLGAYGVQTIVVFLGDSIAVRYNQHVYNSDGMTPAHKGGGQWNRQALGLLANATGEGNDAQIEYYEKGAQYALDTRTWDHVIYVCSSGGHYPYAAHIGQNPLSQQAKDSIDAWVRQYHEAIARPAAARGATVVQMTYLYGCPPNGSPPLEADVYRAFADYFTAKQREAAQAAGFPVCDAYAISQLNTPVPAFYDDQIHPSAAGSRLIAQEFAACIANPDSTAPRSLSRPVIEGAPVVGAQLSITNGAWEFSPDVLTVQWMQDATDLAGETNSTYALQAADAGHFISCRVTAMNAAGSAERTSAHTSRVLAPVPAGDRIPRNTRGAADPDFGM